jgi:hypothetical protein
MARKASTAKVVVIGRLHFLVESKSEDGNHCVDLEPVDDEWPRGGCTCQGFQVRKTCSHVDAVLDYLLDLTV